MSDLWDRSTVCVAVMRAFWLLWTANLIGSQFRPWSRSKDIFLSPKIYGKNIQSKEAENIKSRQQTAES